jgi:hypothetical protein
MRRDIPKNGPAKDDDKNNPGGDDHPGPEAPWRLYSVTLIWHRASVFRLPIADLALLAQIDRRGSIASGR